MRLDSLTSLPPLTETPSGPNPRLLLYVAVGAAVLHFAFFALLSYARHDELHSRSFDLAIAVRTLWGLARSDFYEPFTEQPWIAYHFEPVLLPLSLFSYIMPAAVVLLLTQTAALTAACIPAWRLGRRKLGTPFGGLAAALAVLLYPVVQQINVREFHTVALAIAPGLFLIDALDRGARRTALIAGLLCIACREDAACFVGLCLLAAPWPDGQNPRLKRLALAVMCFVGYGLYAFVLKPALSSGGSVAIHFGHLGATPGEVVGTLLTEPGRAFAAVFTPRNVNAMLALLAPLAFLPLLAPRILLTAGFTLGLNAISRIGALDVVDNHYNALAVPGLIAAAIFGAARLQGWIKRPAVGPVIGPAVLLSAGILGTALWGALPGAGGHFPEDYASGPRAEAYRALLENIQADPSVPCSVPIDALAHVAERREPAEFPKHLDRGGWALVDLDSQPVAGSTRERYLAKLRATLHEMTHGGGYDIVDARGPLVLLQWRGPLPVPPLGPGDGPGPRETE